MPQPVIDEAWAQGEPRQPDAVSPEAYVHRIGRAGRAGAGGVAVTLVEPRERALLRSVERLTRHVDMVWLSTSQKEVSATLLPPIAIAQAITAISGSVSRPSRARAHEDEKLVELLERLAHPTSTPGGNGAVENFLRGIEVVHDIRLAGNQGHVDFSAGFVIDVSARPSCSKARRRERRSRPTTSISS